VAIWGVLAADSCRSTRIDLPGAACFAQFEFDRNFDTVLEAGRQYEFAFHCVDKLAECTHAQFRRGVSLNP
jgi:hypothetical protein